MLTLHKVAPRKPHIIETHHQPNQKKFKFFLKFEASSPQNKRGKNEKKKTFSPQKAYY